MSDTVNVAGTSSNCADKAVQTVVKVYPFLLPPSRSHASITSDKKFSTVLSFDASQNTSKFYSLLQYCPYNDIQHDSIRVINLPRKPKLQWSRANHFTQEHLQLLTLADDDGVAEACHDLLLGLRNEKKITYRNNDTQTDLTVRPYLLEEPHVAIVYRTVDTQSLPVSCFRKVE